MKKTLCFLAVLLSLAFAWAQGVNAEGTPKAESNKKTAVKKAATPARTVFDLGHGEIFSPTKEGDLNYTSFYRMADEAGGKAGVNEGPITTKALKGVKTYIVAGPSMGFTEPEGAALKKFVNGGGNLLVLLHISPPVAALTGQFGIIVSNFVICEKEGLIDGHSQDFNVTRFAEHPVTSGLQKVAVYGTWGLMADQGAIVVASTSDQAWMDTDRNRTFTENEPVEKVGIIAVREAGKGKVVVVADDAPFANKFIGEADNTRLAGNILKWFR
ncbi:MAG TPA: hypothetical protein DDW94_04460 [Deltaproteobacteria bacterium]|nr:MAG: hypothetical protein A2Z79_12915 [Deltaproteobacteria bacterium GWA2_55_82]OGQ62780.1 MAG: hypothetical protein A3I81_11690 [Deltaproteobacteria bacterium RIFCSPLOWO2_02_FULL_55_12]OIJ73498.1 MAG: hypothetical protein A2V21_303985 [Deltaproteobacteria bacterium GWC2_55_46]HBG46226.1 hypothetical protein [Deltaproteobacteria bacterium]HCY10133.1 hypothetical protein [Deltaproteobacteria bacterium]